MEAATTRMASRSSARHGPAAQFTGKVRKWQKKWTKTGVADRLQVYKWVPLAFGQAGTEDAWEADPKDRQRSVPLSVLLASAKDEKDRLAREAAEKVAAEERARVAAQEAQKQAEAPPATEVVEIPADEEAAPEAAPHDEEEAQPVEAVPAMDGEPRNTVGSPAPGTVPGQAVAETALEDGSREPAVDSHIEEAPAAAPPPVDAAVAREIGSSEQAEASPTTEADGQGEPSSHLEDNALEQQEVNEARDETMEEAEEQEGPGSNPGTSSEPEEGQVVWKDDTGQGEGAADVQTGAAGPGEAPPSLANIEQEDNQASPSDAKALDSGADNDRDSVQGPQTDQTED